MIYYLHPTPADAAADDVVWTQCSASTRSTLSRHIFQGPQGISIQFRHLFAAPSLVHRAHATCRPNRSFVEAHTHSYISVAAFRTRYERGQSVHGVRHSFHSGPHSSYRLPRSRARPSSSAGLIPDECDDCAVTKCDSPAHTRPLAVDEATPSTGSRLPPPAA